MSIVTDEATGVKYIYFTDTGGAGRCSIVSYTGNETNLTIPSVCGLFSVGDVPVVAISDGAFQSTSIVNITLPSTLTTIGDNAFRNSSLLYVSFPSSLTHIGANAFENTGLSTLGLSCQSNLTIGNHAFSGCSMLTTVTLDNVTLKDYVWFGCSSLASVSITNLSSMGTHVFEGCASLTICVLEGTYPSIPDSTFQNCVSLDIMEIPSNVQTIGANAFRGCSAFPESGTFYIPDTVTRLGDNACTGMTGATHLATRSTRTRNLMLGDSVFQGCTSLASVTLSRVTGLGKDVFQGCTLLSSCTIHGTYTTIGGYMFSAPVTCFIPSYVTSLDVRSFPDGSTLLFAGNPPAVEGGELFSGTNTTLHLYQDWETYAPDWKLYAGIQPFYGCVVYVDMSSTTPADYRVEPVPTTTTTTRPPLSNYTFTTGQNTTANTANSDKWDFHTWNSFESDMQYYTLSTLVLACPPESLFANSAYSSFCANPRATIQGAKCTQTYTTYQPQILNLSDIYSLEDTAFLVPMNFNNSYQMIVTDGASPPNYVRLQVTNNISTEILTVAPATYVNSLLTIDNGATVNIGQLFSIGAYTLVYYGNHVFGIVPLLDGYVDVAFTVAGVTYRTTQSSTWDTTAWNAFECYMLGNSTLSITIACPPASLFQLCPNMNIQCVCPVTDIYNGYMNVRTIDVRTLRNTHTTAFLFPMGNAAMLTDGANPPNYVFLSIGYKWTNDGWAFVLCTQNVTYAAESQQITIQPTQTQIAVGSIVQVGAYSLVYYDLHVFAVVPSIPFGSSGQTTATSQTWTKEDMTEFETHLLTTPTTTHIKLLPPPATIFPNPLYTKFLQRKPFLQAVPLQNTQAPEDCTILDVRALTHTSNTAFFFPIRPDVSVILTDGAPQPSYVLLTETETGLCTQACANRTPSGPIKHIEVGQTYSVGSYVLMNYGLNGANISSPIPSSSGGILDPNKDSCLLKGTLVHSPMGYVAIETLKEGDPIFNQDNVAIRVEQMFSSTYTFQTNDPFSVIYKIPKGASGNKTHVYLTRGHRVIRKNGNGVLPEKLGFVPAPYSEVFDEKGSYTVYHIRVQDSEKNHLVVNGGCVVESWK